MTKSKIESAKKLLASGIAPKDVAKTSGSQSRRCIAGCRLPVTLNKNELRRRTKMSTNHSHALPSERNEKSLWIALALTGSFLLAEVAAGIVFNSLALLSDAAHMFTDAAALAIALAAVRVARRPADAAHLWLPLRNPCGRIQAPCCAFGVAGYILYEGWQRLREPAQVQSSGMLVVAVLGLIVNLISMRMLQGGKDKSLNVKGAYLEVWSDMLGSIGVIGAALVIRFTGWVWVDAVVAVAIGLWVLPRTWLLLKESLNVLLEGVPDGIDMGALMASVQAVPGVTGLHDLHVWALTSGKVSMTAHIVYAPEIGPDELLKTLKLLLADRFSIFHTTLQLEIVACEHSVDGCNFVDHRHKEPSSQPDQAAARQA
jgi:cobalt-zinc-cadmium efflux system protein